MEIQLWGLSQTQAQILTLYFALHSLLNGVVCSYLQVGNHIDVKTGRWTATDAGIGAGVDSYFEYLAKGAMLFQYPELMDMLHGEFWV